MRYKIKNEQYFRPADLGWSLSPSTEGTTLQCTDDPVGKHSVDADGNIIYSAPVWDDVKSIDAGDRICFKGTTTGLWFRLKDNESEVFLMTGTYAKLGPGPEEPEAPVDDTPEETPGEGGEGGDENNEETPGEGGGE